MGLSQHLAPLSDYQLQHHAPGIQISFWRSRQNDFDWRHSIHVGQGMIYCMERVTMNTSVTRSLAIIASRSRSLIRRWHVHWILEPCAGFRFDGPVLVAFLGRRLVASFTHCFNSSIESAHDRVLLPARSTWARQELFIKFHFSLSAISLLLECARIGRRRRVTCGSAVRVLWSKWLSAWWAVWMWNSKPWDERSFRSWSMWLFNVASMH